MRTPYAWYNEHAAFKAWLDGAAPAGVPMPYQAAQPDLMGGAPYFLPHQHNAMIVAAPEDKPWPPAWIWPKEPTMSQIQGFGAAVLLFLAGIYWHRFSGLILVGGALGIFKVLTKGAVDNAVHNNEEKLRVEGRLLPKAAPNPVYNIVPLPM